MEDIGDLGSAPNDKWAKFFTQFSEIETLETSKWKPVHLIGYFCKKYYQAYNVKYQFKFNSPSPVKSFEVFQIKRLALLLSSNSTVLRDYIDWAFKEKTEKNKRRVTSISFITNEELVNNYKFNVLLANNGALHIDRSTQLPQDCQNVIKNLYDTTVKTYGDLAFLNAALAADSKWQTVVSELQIIGFDVSILEKIV